MRKIDPLELFSLTPLLKWWKRGEWAKPSYIPVHFSDAARFVLLWKYGGFYIDLDTITLKSVQPVSVFSSVGLLFEGDSEIVCKAVKEATFLLYFYDCKIFSLHTFDLIGQKLRNATMKHPKINILHDFSLKGLVLSEFEFEN